MEMADTYNDSVVNASHGWRGFLNCSASDRQSRARLALSVDAQATLDNRERVFHSSDSEATLDARANNQTDNRPLLSWRLNLPGGYTASPLFARKYTRAVNRSRQHLDAVAGGIVKLKLDISRIMDDSGYFNEFDPTQYLIEESTNLDTGNIRSNSQTIGACLEEIIANGNCSSYCSFPVSVWSDAWNNGAHVNSGLPNDKKIYLQDLTCKNWKAVLKSTSGKDFSDFFLQVALPEMVKFLDKKSDFECPFESFKGLVYEVTRHSSLMNMDLKSFSRRLENWKLYENSSSSANEASYKAAILEMVIANAWHDHNDEAKTKPK